MNKLIIYMKNEDIDIVTLLQILYKRYNCGIKIIDEKGYSISIGGFE